MVGRVIFGAHFQDVTAVASFLWFPQGWKQGAGARRGAKDIIEGSPMHPNCLVAAFVLVIGPEGLRLTRVFSTLGIDS